jgi:hypothetical protein
MKIAEDITLKSSRQQTEDITEDSKQNLFFSKQKLNLSPMEMFLVPKLD